MGYYSVFALDVREATSLLSLRQPRALYVLLDPFRRPFRPVVLNARPTLLLSILEALVAFFVQLDWYQLLERLLVFCVHLAHMKMLPEYVQIVWLPVYLLVVQDSVLQTLGRYLNLLVDEIVLIPFKFSSAGFGLVDGFCTGCIPGFFAIEGNSGLCSSCAPGQYSSASSSTCSACPAGYFGNDWNTTTCSRCPGGQTSPIGSTACTTCDTGSYEIGVNSCASCMGNGTLGILSCGPVYNTANTW